MSNLKCRNGHEMPTFEQVMESWEEVDFSKIEHYLTRPDKTAWPESRAKKAIENFKAFFALNPFADFQLVPTPDIDEVCHACMIRPVFYSQALCMKVLGELIDHEPDDDMTPESVQFLETNRQKTGEIFQKMTEREYSDDAEIAQLVARV